MKKGGLLVKPPEELIGQLSKSHRRNSAEVLNITSFISVTTFICITFSMIHLIKAIIQIKILLH